MIRVLHFLPVYAPAWQFGGPVLSVSRLCEGLVKEGLHVRVITTNAGIPNFPCNELGVPQWVNGVEVFYYSVNNHGFTIRSDDLLAGLAEHTQWADLLHLSSIWHPLGLSVQVAAHHAGIPVIQTPRGALGPYSLIHKWYKKVPYLFLRELNLLNKASSLHCTSIQEATELNWLHLRPPIEVLPNPVDTSKLLYDPQLGQQWRESRSIPTNKKLFIVAGRLHHKKGLDLLPRVFSTVSRSDWVIVFIGSDDDGTKSSLQKKFASYHLSHHCIWIDIIDQDQLCAAYNAADFLLLPSRHENFGNVVIEALACGCGAIISDAVGVSSDVMSCPGVSILPRVSYQWSSEIHSSFERSRPGSTSVSFVYQSFTTSAIAKKCKTIYSRLLNNV